MSRTRVFAIGALVAVVALVTVAAVETWRSLCRGLSLQTATGVPGCPLLVSGPSVDVVFPEDWQAGEVSRSTYQDVVRGGGPWVSDVAVGWDEDARSGCVAVAAEANGSPIPQIMYPPEAGWSLVLRAAGRTEPSGSEGVSRLPLSSDELTLPIGPAARVVHSLPDGRSGTQYSVSDRGGVLILACYAETTPPDRWLSIAETLRFLSDH